MKNKDVSVKMTLDTEMPVSAFFKQWAKITHKERQETPWRNSKFRRLNKRKQKKIDGRTFKGILFVYDGSTCPGSEPLSAEQFHAKNGPSEIKLVTEFNI